MLVIRKFYVDQEQTPFLDTSLTDMDGLWLNRVYATLVRDIPDFHLTLVYLEMLNLFKPVNTKFLQDLVNNY